MALLPPPRPRVYRLAPDDLARAFDDPGLAALAAEGWTTAGLVPAADGDRPVLLLILWPPAPRPATDSRVTAVAAAVASVAAAVMAWMVMS